MKLQLTRLVMAAAIGLVAAMPAQSQTRVIFKSAKTYSTYYQMAVQLAEVIKRGTGGDIIVLVEESQGSVPNIKKVAKRSGNYYSHRRPRS